MATVRRRRPAITFSPEDRQMRLWRRIRSELGRGAESAIRESAEMGRARMNQDFISRGLYDTTRRGTELGGIDRRMGQDIAAERSRIGMAALGQTNQMMQSRREQSNWEIQRQDRLRLIEQQRAALLAKQRQGQQMTSSEAEQAMFLAGIMNAPQVMAGTPASTPAQAKPVASRTATTPSNTIKYKSGGLWQSWLAPERIPGSIQYKSGGMWKRYRR